jgi:hypothetical protein
LYNRAEGVQTLAVSVPAEAANAGARLSVALLGEGLALELDAGVGLPVHHGPVLAQRGHTLSQAPAEVLPLKTADRNRPKTMQGFLTRIYCT